MATLANEVRQAALNGIAALFNNGLFRLDDSGDNPLAVLGFAATAFGAATNASPSVAVSGSISPDNSPTAGTFTKFLLQTSAPATRFNGTVGTSGTDMVVTDNVIPGTAVQVACSAGLTLTLQLSA